ncbi:thromboxane-A synthase [Danio aesculapii]|uniref:thromboxane-A synthase n=1 Tax=Danio aesculapii TaxID=1142201 RepID=UPI0024BF489A|nr:thromboxane-A synthase [Danio aesculapii]
MQLLVDGLKWFGVEASGFSVTVCLFLLFLSLLYWYSISPFSTLERCGIKHPKPFPFIGNLMMFRNSFFDDVNNIILQIGRVCVYYIGRRSTVIIADPDMLRQVMVKEFNKFPNRMTVRGITKPMSDSLIMLKGEQWKRVRSILTPTFSAAKMKEMVPLINTATETLLRNLKSHAESGNSFNIHKCFGCFTMDVIASVAFGTQVDSQNNPDDPFVHQASKFFAFSFFRPIMIFFMAFPFLLRPLAGLLPNKSRDEMNSFFTRCIQKMIKQRDDLPPEQRRKDFLQLMLDVRTNNKCLSVEHFDVVNDADEEAYDGHENSPANESTKRSQQKRMMTEDEIVGQSFIFLVAGYETSSNTLAFACYLLAVHPECQKKLQEEVDEFFSRHETVDYANVQELKYLDMVIFESLRLYPPAFRVARDVEEDTVLNGQFLPKGASLEIATGFLHYDPQHWTEPTKFIPERFTPEAKARRHPFVYLPFGAGPRSCVGMRLAQLEIKVALVHIFKRFNVVACEDTEIPLEVKSHTTLGPKNGVMVKITERDNLEDAS